MYFAHSCNVVDVLSGIEFAPVGQVLAERLLNLRHAETQPFEHLTCKLQLVLLVLCHANDLSLLAHKHISDAVSRYKYMGAKMSASTDLQLVVFRRQYLQLFEPDFLLWPPKQLLRDAGVQTWLYNNLFNAERISYLPSERYQLRVLKPLLAKIEKSFQDPEEDVGVALSSLSSDMFQSYSLPSAVSDCAPDA